MDFSVVSVLLGSFESSGWFGTRTASQNHVLVFGSLFWYRPGLFCVDSGRAGLGARAERLCAAGASGEKFFLCVCVVSRPVSVVQLSAESLG